MTKLTEAHHVQDNEFDQLSETDVAEDLEGLSMQNQRLSRVLEYEEAAVAHGSTCGHLRDGKRLPSKDFRALGRGGFGRNG